ncbi:CopG family antitoxin [Marinospirillum sp.]|uniref:CopG family antitoxin n=1 Tax=Marinospirillum sp. TaxID=2183934 RepID=UPI00345AFBCA
MKQKSGNSGKATTPTDYLDWSQAKPASLPKLKPSTKTISLRLPETLLDRIKIEAKKRNMPY